MLCTYEIYNNFTHKTNSTYSHFSLVTMRFLKNFKFEHNVENI